MTTPSYTGLYKAVPCQVVVVRVGNSSLPLVVKTIFDFMVGEQFHGITKLTAKVALLKLRHIGSCKFSIFNFFFHPSSWTSAAALHVQDKHMQSHDPMPHPH